MSSPGDKQARKHNPSGNLATPLTEGEAYGDPNITLASSSITRHEGGEREHSSRARNSRNPARMDEGLLRQIPAVLPSPWEDKELEELQRLTTKELTKLAKGLTYMKFTGQHKRVSVSGSKAAVIGRILAWQTARQQGEARESKELDHSSDQRGSTEPWSVDETARLLMTIVDADMYAAVAKAYQQANRQEIDASQGSFKRAAWQEIAKR